MIDEGFSAVFTMYGTAANEFPFLGVPSVSAADNPHVACKFLRTPATPEEHRKIVHEVDSQAVLQDTERIPEFVFMNLLYGEEHLGAKSKICTLSRRMSRTPLICSRRR
jgi:hypothetical protein